MECTLETVAAVYLKNNPNKFNCFNFITLFFKIKYDSAEKTVNKTNLKEAFIGMTSLPEDKKKSAGLYVDRCLAQEKLHLPKCNLK